MEVTADVSGITDRTDGLANAFFHYQWIQVDGTAESELDGETGSTYTPTADDVGKHLKVRVIFDDDAGNKEYPRTSRQVGPVVAKPPGRDGELRAGDLHGGRGRLCDGEGAAKRRSQAPGGGAADGGERGHRVQFRLLGRS